MNKKHKKIGLFAFIFGSLIKLLFFTKKPPTLHQNVPQYNPQASDQEYVGVDLSIDKPPDFTPPIYRGKIIFPDNNFRDEDTVIRSPDGSA